MAESAIEWTDRVWNPTKERAVTYRCVPCDVNWWPYQAKDGHCPQCGKGTVRVNEAGSLDADALYKRAMTARAAAADRHAKRAAFERYYAAREDERCRAAAAVAAQDQLDAEVRRRAA